MFIFIEQTTKFKGSYFSTSASLLIKIFYSIDLEVRNQYLLSKIRIIFFKSINDVKNNLHHKIIRKARIKNSGYTV